MRAKASHCPSLHHEAATVLIAAYSSHAARPPPVRRTGPAWNNEPAQRHWGHMQTHHFRVLSRIALIGSACLAGCGTSHRSATVAQLLADPGAYAREATWCSGQSQPSRIAGCRAVRTAGFIQQTPQLDAQVGKSEPYPGRDLRFFENSPAVQAELSWCTVRMAMLPSAPLDGRPADSVYMTMLADRYFKQISSSCAATATMLKLML